jgi:hypothetical protein
VNRSKSYLYVIVILFLAAGCTSYKRQPVSFKMPAAYPNAMEVAGAPDFPGGRRGKSLVDHRLKLGL